MSEKKAVRIIPSNMLDIPNKGQHRRRNAVRKNNPLYHLLKKIDPETAEMKLNRRNVIQSILSYPFDLIEAPPYRWANDGRNDFKIFAQIMFFWNDDYTLLSATIRGDMYLPLGEVDITQQNSILSIRCHWCRPSLCKHSIFVLLVLSELFHLNAPKLGKININKGMDKAATKSELVEQLKNGSNIAFDCYLELNW